MSVESTLRRAAALMRERAEEPVAQWPQVVALAVADWLEHQANYAELTGSDYSGGQSHGSHALAVANAYMREDR